MRANCDEDIWALLQDMNRSSEGGGGVEFKVEKCEVMHFSWRNLKTNYF